jgi:hypothetical protein
MPSVGSTGTGFLRNGSQPPLWSQGRPSPFKLASFGAKPAILPWSKNFLFRRRSRQRAFCPAHEAPNSTAQRILSQRIVTCSCHAPADPHIWRRHSGCRCPRRAQWLICAKAKRSNPSLTSGRSNAPGRSATFPSLRPALADQCRSRRGCLPTKRVRLRGCSSAPGFRTHLRRHR